MKNIIDIEVVDLSTLDGTLQAAINTLRGSGVRVAAAAQIYDARESHIWRILLERATDRQRALQSCERSKSRCVKPRFRDG